ncbi:hypothetical protein Tco_1088200 [Tanacetum coccineum]
MDDPNITMEEYIRLEEEKARRQGRTFNWQTDTYGKMEYYENKDDSFTDLETEYPAIVFDDTSDVAFSREPTKWHYETPSKARSTETFNELAAIQAQLNNLRREIKKVNEKVYAAQVECELCKGPHYTKDCPLKEEGNTLEEAYYTQFGTPYQPVG